MRIAVCREHLADRVGSGGARHRRRARHDSELVRRQRPPLLRLHRLAARLGWATGGGDGGEGEGEGEGAAERETRREKLVEAEGGGEGGAPFEKRGARAFIFRNGGTPSEP